MSAFRILSLDGGGTWALIEAMALQALYGERAKGHEILRRFDLVAGNSGGSIVLAGLAADLALDEILRFFMDEQRRRAIFVKVPPYRWLNPLRIAVHGPRYVTLAKQEGLAAALGEACATELPALAAAIGANHRGEAVRLLIPAFDYDRKRVAFFRSDLRSPASNFPRDGAATLLQAVHASSTAPVRYFDAPAQFPPRRYWDGAVAGYNNPVFAAVIEAFALGVAPQAIVAVSLGTGSVHLPLDGEAADETLVQQPARSSIAGDLGILSRSITDDPPDAASFEAHVALGGRLPASRDDPVRDGALVRLNPLIQPVAANGRWDFPPGIDRREFARLLAMEMDALAQEDLELIAKFAERWIAGDIPNQPIRTNRFLECEIGQPRFADGARLVRERT